MESSGRPSLSQVNKTNYLESKNDVHEFSKDVPKKPDQYSRLEDGHLLNTAGDYSQYSGLTTTENNGHTRAATTGVQQLVMSSLPPSPSKSQHPQPANFQIPTMNMTNNLDGEDQEFLNRSTGNDFHQMTKVQHPKQTGDSNNLPDVNVNEEPSMLTSQNSIPPATHNSAIYPRNTTSHPNSVYQPNLSIPPAQSVFQPVRNPNDAPNAAPSTAHHHQPSQSSRQSSSGSRTSRRRRTFPQPQEQLVSTPKSWNLLSLRDWLNLLTIDSFQLFIRVKANYNHCKNTSEEELEFWEWIKKCPTSDSIVNMSDEKYNQLVEYYPNFKKYLQKKIGCANLNPATLPRSNAFLSNNAEMIKKNVNSYFECVRNRRQTARKNEDFAKKDPIFIALGEEVTQKFNVLKATRSKLTDLLDNVKQGRNEAIQLIFDACDSIAEKWNGVKSVMRATENSETALTKFKNLNAAYNEAAAKKEANVRQLGHALDFLHQIGSEEVTRLTSLAGRVHPDRISVTARSAAITEEEIDFGFKQLPREQQLVLFDGFSRYLEESSRGEVPCLGVSAVETGTQEVQTLDRPPQGIYEIPQVLQKLWNGTTVYTTPVNFNGTSTRGSSHHTFGNDLERAGKDCRTPIGSLKRRSNNKNGEAVSVKKTRARSADKQGSSVQNDKPITPAPPSVLLSHHAPQSPADVSFSDIDSPGVFADVLSSSLTKQHHTPELPPHLADFILEYSHYPPKA